MIRQKNFHNNYIVFWSLIQLQVMEAKKLTRELRIRQEFLLTNMLNYNSDEILNKNVFNGENFQILKIYVKYRHSYMHWRMPIEIIFNNVV